MRFRFKCQAVHHASGRVTLTPLDFPELSVHGATLEGAVEELSLGFDDRIARAHPRRLAGFARPSVGEPLTLSVPVLQVRGAVEDELRNLGVNAVVAPAQKPYSEVRVPRLGVRYWLLAGSDLAEGATTLLTAALGREDASTILSLRAEGREELLDVEVEVTPLRLSDLKPRELFLDERAPLSASSTRNGDGEDDDHGLFDQLDDGDEWDETPGRKRRDQAKRVPATPTLGRLGTPWHTLAARGELPPAWERDELLETLRARLSALAPEPVVLVGPAGAGKTAVLHELARRLAAETMDPRAAGSSGGAGARARTGRSDHGEVRPRPFWFVDGARLVAGEGFLGDWQRQVLDVLSEARRAGALLCLGHLESLLDAGRSAHSDSNVAQLLQPALAARDVAVIAEATPESWAQVEKRNQSFARAFTVVRVDEPAPAATLRILVRTAEALAEERSIAVGPEVTGLVVSLCARFLPYGALVGNAVALLRRLVDARAHALAGRITASDALALFSSETGIPAVLLRDELALDDDAVRAFLRERVKGQEEAVARAAEVIAVIKANLADRRRPTAVLLFAGPTGVGKTELAKALTEFVFGSPARLVRLDMGEYAGPDALARLVGEGRTPGYLTSAVRRQPFSVVLLDEIEKAHPAVFDALLGVLDEGRLSDAAGRFTDFRAAVIVMTSNLGAETFRARAGFGGAPGARDLDLHYRAEAQRFFRPELYNRLDEVVVFHPLGRAEIGLIVERELARVAAREGLRRREVKLEVTAEAAALLAEQGVDAHYGARPLKRAIERGLVTEVASWLAEHRTPGAQRLLAGVALGTGAQGTLKLAAESLGDGVEGVSRAAIERVLERAARLRAEVRRWSRSQPMTRLRQELQLFDRQSRHPGFWHDRAVADERARAAAEGRELAAAWLAAERAAEAAEDLAYEAFYTRQVAAGRSLELDLDQVEAQLDSLGERLLGSLYPPRRAVTLFIQAGRGGAEHVAWLLHGYRRWAERRGGQVLTWIARATELADEEPARAKNAKKSGTEKSPGKEAQKGPEPVHKKGRKKSAAAALTWLWERGWPTPGETSCALQVNEARGLMLLAGEHGVHRFTAGGDTQLVRVRFVPDRVSPYPDPPALSQLMPVEEVRRVWPEKRQARDLRTGITHELSPDLPDGGFDLEPLIAPWLRLRVFGRAGTE